MGVQIAAYRVNLKVPVVWFNLPAKIKVTEAFGLSYDVVDDMTGKKLGRASSGTRA